MITATSWNKLGPKRVKSVWRTARVDGVLEPATIVSGAWAGSGCCMVAWVSFLVGSALAFGPYEGSLLPTISGDMPRSANAEPTDGISVVTTTAVLRRGDETVVPITLSVPSGHQVYRDAVSVAALSVTPPVMSLVGVATPAGITPPASSDEPDRERYVADVTVSLMVRAATDAALGLSKQPLTVTWQACRPGLCWPPAERQVDLLVRIVE